MCIRDSDNTAGGGIPQLGLTPVGYNMGAAPYVRANDVTGGNAPAITGKGYVTSNPLPTSPQQTKAGVAVSMAAAVTLFPNYPDSTVHPSLGSKGAVGAILDQGSVDCVSGTSAVDGTIVGKYTLRVFWWGRGPADASPRWHLARWTYDSSVNATPVPTVGAGYDTWDPANTTLDNGLRLSSLVNGPAAPGVVNTGANNGLRGFPSGIFTLTTAPTLLNETSAGFSAINVQLGQLSCVADDQR